MMSARSPRANYKGVSQTRKTSGGVCESVWLVVVYFCVLSVSWAALMVGRIVLAVDDFFRQCVECFVSCIIWIEVDLPDYLIRAFVSLSDLPEHLFRSVVLGFLFITE